MPTFIASRFTRRWIILRHLCILALLALLAGCTTRAKPEPIWIGHITPLSGPRRESGEEAVRAIESVLTSAHEENLGVGGRPVGVRHVDSVKDGRAEATRLLAVNRVAALLVGPGVENVEDILAAARSHSAPVVVLDEVASPPDWSGAFLLGPDPAQRGRALAKYAREKLKLGKVAALVDSDRTSGVVFAEAFAKAWRQEGGTLREWDLAALSQPGRKAEVRAFAPAALLVAVPGAQLEKASEAWSDLADGRVLLFGGESGADVRLGWKPDEKDVAGLYGVAAFAAKAKLPEPGQKFLDALGKRQGSPPGRSAVFAADGIRFVLDGLKAAGTPQREALQKALEGIREFESLTGTMTWQERRPVRTLYVVRSPGDVVETIGAKE